MHSKPQTAIKHLASILLIALLAFFAYRIDSLHGPPLAQVSARIEIHKPLAEVWRVVADLEGWSEWNKWEVLRGMNVTGAGEVEEGQVGTLDLALTGNGFIPNLPITLDFLDHESHHLQWSGGLPVLFYARHSWKVTAVSDDTTAVEDVEQFWRFAAWVGVAGKKDKLNWGMLVNLKDFMEAE
ncbi:hypothetical protein HDU98_007004 [Podochytrium sp. JEL0797]|nr:hypothetical protein HDU98_007004 [Podochytrium sp. JEL0797]